MAQSVLQQGQQAPDRRMCRAALTPKMMDIAPVTIAVPCPFSNGGPPEFCFTAWKSAVNEISPFPEALPCICMIVSFP